MTKEDKRGIDYDRATFLAERAKYIRALRSAGYAWGEMLEYLNLADGDQTRQIHEQLDIEGWPPPFGPKSKDAQNMTETPLPLVRVKMGPRGPQPDDGVPVVAAETRTERRPPGHPGRNILPMSTGTPILPTQSAQITGPPPALGCKIGRFVISNAGTAGGAADWLVNNIKINDVSQFLKSGDVPGTVFATSAPDDEGAKFVQFTPTLTRDDNVVIVVTYIGRNELGCPFFGALVWGHPDDFADETTVK